MPVYIYTARDMTSEIVCGQLVAQSELSVVEFIRSQGLFVTSVKEKSEPLAEFIRRKLSPVTCRDIAHFYQQFAALLNAGLPILSCLNFMHDQTSNLELKSAVLEIYRLMQSGSTLTDAMKCYPRIFSPLAIGMIHSGEIGGVLNETLNELVRYYSKQDELSAKVKNALLYPALIAGLSVLVLVYLVYHVLPMFIEFYNGMGMKIPDITIFAVNFFNFVTKNILLFLAVMICMVLYLKRKVSTGTGQVITSIILKMPVFGSLWQKIMVARFCRTLGTLLHCGVPLLTAVGAIKNMSNNELIYSDIQKIEVQLKKGGNLSLPIASSLLFTEFSAEMIAVGEQTGELDSMLLKTAEYHEQESEYQLSRLTTLFEPLCIIVAAIFVAIIILVVLLPMMQAVSDLPDLSEML